MKKSSSPQTLAIIAAIESSSQAAKMIADAVRSELVTHTQQDDARHEENRQTLALISADVKSLLASRSFSKGIWKAVTILATAVSGVVSIGIAILRAQ